MRRRPALHFTPDHGWMNDPHGIVHANGEYHLFFQYVPRDVEWQSDLDWGHAVSDDLVHWRQLGSAITPAPDETGCWSGSVVLAERPTMLYTNPTPSDWGRGQVVLAYGTDDLRTWEHGPVVIDGQPDERFRDFRDPQVRREGDRWVMTIGAGMNDDSGGVALQYTSQDLHVWHFDGVLAFAPFDPRALINTGQVWECPQFLRVDDRWVLLLSAMDHGQTYARQIYGIGDYDGRVFTPTAWGDVGHGPMPYAATTFRDVDNRPCMMAWLRERQEELPEPSAWTGSQSIVHELHVVDGRLHTPFHRNLDVVLPAIPLVDALEVDFTHAQRFTVAHPRWIEIRDASHVVELRFTDDRVCVIVDAHEVLVAECATPREVDLVVDADLLEFVCDGVEGMFAVRIPALTAGTVAQGS